MRLRPPHVLALTGILVSSLALAGCSTSPAARVAGGPIAVVASTDVYGDIAKSIGGSAVAVTSIISDPSQDPHSYEADAQVQLSLSKAQVVVENGAGYDDFVDTLLQGANNDGATVLTAAKISGFDLHPASGDFNEHLWFDFSTMHRVVARLVATFSRLDPKHAADIARNAASFDAQLTTLEKTEADIKRVASGVGAAITEPVPLYLLDAAGLTNKTPAKFSEAVEEGADVSPAVLEKTLALFRNHSVKVLAYNEQTSGPETDAVLRAARQAGVAIVPVTETLPADTHYIAWMAKNLALIRAAVS
jgi:zinc/manganese transport system substrate-binding protein